MKKETFKKLAASIKRRAGNAYLSDAEALKLAADLAGEIGRRIGEGEDVGFLRRVQPGSRKLRLQVVDLDNISKREQ